MNKKHDDWLDKHESLLKASKPFPILDLGCGKGNDTIYLHERKYPVISCDLCEESLKSLRQHIPDANTRCLNFLNRLPFPDNFTKIIIADLSLHYFSWNDTRKILNEIFRVLKPEGYLLCRVNSEKDVNYGAGQGYLIEENYFQFNGHCKRFFNEKQLRELFDKKQILFTDEYSIDRYSKEKILWEIVIKNQNLKEFSLKGFDTEKGIKNTGGSKAFYKKMLFDFSRDYQNYAEKIKEHLENNQFDEAKRCAHSIKGVARTLGAEELAKISIQIETSIQSKNKEKFKQQYPSLEKGLSDVCRVISELEHLESAENILQKNEKVKNDKINEDLIYTLDKLHEFVKLGNYKAEKMAFHLQRQYADNRLASFFDELFHAVVDLDSEKASKCISTIKNSIEGETKNVEKT